MADGDKVHVNLTRRYQKPYQQVCEGQYGDKELAHEILRPLRRDLRDYGDEPLQLIQQVATELDQIPAEPLLKQSVNWGEKSQRIERRAQQIDGHLKALALAVQACQRQLQELRSSIYPHDLTKDDLTKEMYKKYISAVYKANFEERVPLAQHYNGVDQGTVDTRLKGMRIHVDQGIESFAAQMIRNGSVTPLRRPPMTRPPIGIHDDLCLVQIPMRLDESTDLHKEPSQRSRGFVFMLLGAACAYLAGKRTLQIYENGIGAINLPFRASEVELDHTRSVHPLSLLYMSDLVKELLGTRFHCENPFQFSTKAMMCQALVETDCVDLAFETISCDRLHREKPMQCGSCSSCLLRRQALAVQGVEDQTGYIATARLAESQAPRQLPLLLKPLKNIAIAARPVESQVPLWPKNAHRLAMLRQVEGLRALLSIRPPWASLVCKYPQIADVVDQTAPFIGIAPEVMRERLIRLYQTYVCEWDSARDSVGEGLLDSVRMQGAA